MAYIPWREKKKTWLKLMLGVQIAVLLLGSTVLDARFAVIVVPLYLFSMAVIFYGAHQYVRDGDVEVIHRGLFTPIHASE
jgi:hypothetical protein